MKLIFISQLINQNKSSDLNLDSYKSLFLFWDIIFYELIMIPIWNTIRIIEVIYILNPRYTVQ